MHPTEESQQAIWQVIAAIPESRVATYGQIAAMAGQAGKSRWVGRLLSQLPRETRLPWHRVVNASGRITNPNFDLQQTRLIAEGIEPRSGRVLLKDHQWRP